MEAYRHWLKEVTLYEEAGLAVGRCDPNSVTTTHEFYVGDQFLTLHVSVPLTAEWVRNACLGVTVTIKYESRPGELNILM